MPLPRLLWQWPELIEDDPRVGQVLDGFASVQSSIVSRVDLPAHVRTCQILVPRLEHEIDVALLDAAPCLRMIGTPSTGTDHIAVAEAQRRGIRVVSIKDEREFLDSVQSTAELAWLLVLACNRNLRTCFKQIEAGGWHAQSVRGHELIDRTLGIIGYGRLGRMVSRFAHAFRMPVIASDPQPITDDWVRQMPQEQLLGAADIVTLHVHLDDRTRGMFGAMQLAKMKRGAFLVNTSRGGLIDEDALVAALESGRLGGAGLDVICGEREEDRTRRPLFRYAMTHDNVILTPHIGGCTVESQQKVVLHFARKLRDAWQKSEPIERE